MTSQITAENARLARQTIMQITELKYTPRTEVKPDKLGFWTALAYDPWKESHGIV